jgi:CheY-like chemotaxis protein
MVLIADDDQDDCMLIGEAVEETNMPVHLSFVEDGEDLIDYLYRRGKYDGNTPRPDLILLDLNMPRKDGREALKEIKSDPDLQKIPIVILTTSKEEEDIIRSYNLGANSFITKPVTFDGLVEAMRSIGRYWFEIVELPPEEKRVSSDG